MRVALAMDDMAKSWVPLHDLAGPYEAAQAAGIRQKSIAYYMTRYGFPQPVKVLHGIRLWSISEIGRWRADFED